MLLSSILDIILFSQKVPHYGKGQYTRPNNSAAGVPEEIGWFIVIVAVVLFVYVAFKLNKGISRGSDSNNKKTD